MSKILDIWKQVKRLYYHSRGSDGGGVWFRSRGINCYGGAVPWWLTFADGHFCRGAWMFGKQAAGPKKEAVHRHARIPPKDSQTSIRTENTTPAFVSPLPDTRLLPESCKGHSVSFSKTNRDSKGRPEGITLCMNAVTYYGELVNWILSHVTDANMFFLQSAVTCCALSWFV
jgi:hypothetical protein